MRDRNLLFGIRWGVDRYDTQRLCGGYSSGLRGVAMKIIDVNHDKFQWILRDIEAFNVLDEQMGREIYELFISYFDKKILESYTTEESVVDENSEYGETKLIPLYSKRQVALFFEFRTALYRVQEQFEFRKKDFQVKQENKKVDEFKFTTKEIVKLLKIKETELAVKRKYKELKSKVHYVRKHSINKTEVTHNYGQVFYNLEKTCKKLYEIPYDEFTRPNFDLEKHKLELQKKQAIREVKRIEKLRKK